MTNYSNMPYNYNQYGYGGNYGMGQQHVNPNYNTQYYGHHQMEDGYQNPGNQIGGEQHNVEHQGQKGDGSQPTVGFLPFVAGALLGSAAYRGYGYGYPYYGYGYPYYGYGYPYGYGYGYGYPYRPYRHY